MDELPQAGYYVVRVMLHGTVACLLLELMLAKVAVAVRGLRQATE